MSYNPPIHPQTCTVGAPPQTMQKDGRKLIVVDVRKTMTAEAADYFIQVQPNKDYEILDAMRCLVADQELDVDKVGGVPVEYLKEVTDAMVNCDFGVIFFGLGLTQSAGRFRNIEIAIALTRDLNRKTKFVISPMRGHFNVTGANVVFAWQQVTHMQLTSHKGTHNITRENSQPSTCSDAATTTQHLVISSDPGANFPKVAMQNMMKHPLITINPDMNAISRLGDVVFPTQWCGIEYEGTAYRMDHVPIMLRKVVEPPKGILNDEELLTKILEEVRAIKAKNPETETKAELKARNKLAPKIEIKQRKKTKKAEVA